MVSKISISTKLIQLLCRQYGTKVLWNNLDKWAIGTPLFITGVGGSGKSTLARQLSEIFNAAVISSDTVIFKMKWSKERFDKKNTSRINEIPVLFSPLALEYVNVYKTDLPTNCTKDGQPTVTDMENEYTHAKDFLNWVTGAEKIRDEWNEMLMIVEGTYPIHAPEEIVGYPVIILCPSRFQAFCNRISRAHENGRNIFVAIKTVIIKYIKYEHWFDKKIIDCISTLITKK